MTEEQRLRRNAYMREWTAEHRDQLNAMRREKYAVGPEPIRERVRQWNARNQEKARETCRRFRTINPGYSTRYAKSSLSRQIAARLHSSLHAALTDRSTGLRAKRQDWRSDSKIAALIGCPKAELRAHFERMFRSGMSWENYGAEGWEIDHIKPISAFDLTDPAQQAACFHFSNLQPLWSVENKRKYNRSAA
jgi:hypothetical protein